MLLMKIAIQRIAIFLIAVMHGDAGFPSYSKFIFLLSSWHPKADIRILKDLCLSGSFLDLPFDVSTPLDCYTWDYRELATLF